MCTELVEFTLSQKMTNQVEKANRKSTEMMLAFFLVVKLASNKQKITIMVAELGDQVFTLKSLKCFMF